MLCTIGMLLGHLIREPYLNGASQLLVNEIHERGMNEDFLLIISHDCLPWPPDLCLILMSMTTNVDPCSLNLQELLQLFTNWG